MQICNVLSGAELTEAFDKADVAECAWGITEAMLLSPPESQQGAFNAEILSYLGNLLDEEGIRTPPAVLKIAMRDTDWSNMDEYEDTPTTDPDLFAASYQAREERTQSVEQALTENMTHLFSQLASIPGFAGDVRQLIEDLRSAGKS